MKNLTRYFFKSLRCTPLEHLVIAPCFLWILRCSLNEELSRCFLKRLKCTPLEYLVMLFFCGFWDVHWMKNFAGASEKDRGCTLLEHQVIAPCFLWGLRCSLNEKLSRCFWKSFRCTPMVHLVIAPCFLWVLRCSFKIGFECFLSVPVCCFCLLAWSLFLHI